MIGAVLRRVGITVGKFLLKAAVMALSERLKREDSDAAQALGAVTERVSQL
jgi:hypothetical protein